jgi:hypothetical protein
VITLVRRAAALFLFAHGFAHMVGFLGSWQLGEFADAPYTTRILNGAVDVGDAGIRLVGLLWIAGAAGFAVAAFELLRRRYAIVAAITGASLAICVVGLPNAIVGVWVNVAILAVLAALALARPTTLRPA